MPISDSITKICKKCKTSYPATKEFFYFRGDKLQCPCKKCQKRNREPYLAKLREKSKIYTANNPDKVKQSNQKYYQEHREQILKNKASARSRNPEILNQRKREWDKQNPDKVRRMAHIRRARIRNLRHDFSETDWENCLNYFGYLCAYCECDLKSLSRDGIHQDHWIPLTRRGEYTKGNILPACANCNHRKANEDPIRWIYKQFGNDIGDSIIERILKYFDHIMVLRSNIFGS